MGHQYKDKVRDAYFLANPKKLREVYIDYVEELTIGIDKPAITRGEFTDLKIEHEIIQEENMKLKKDLKEIQKTFEDYKKIDTEIDEEVLAENTELRDAVTGLMYENEVQKKPFIRINR